MASACERIGGLIVIPDPEPLPIALRAYAPPPTRDQKPVAPSDYTLVFDCETTSDTVHALRFGAFQVRNGDALERSGFFFDPEGLDAGELALLQKVGREELVDVIPVCEFVEDAFFRVAYDLGGLCVGFNLPFDLSRLALRDKASRGQFKGGFSFELTEDEERPRVRVQHRSSTSALIEFVPRRIRRSSDPRGHFIDVRTVARAVLGESFTLKRLADVLGAETRKADAEGKHGARLTRNYIRYGALDVQVTWECFTRLRDRYDSYGLTKTPLRRVASEASIGKGSLREMNIEPWRRMQPRFPAEITGLILSTYFGARSEVRLRLQVAEVAYSDFRSMYATVCTLMGLWEFVISQGMDHRDATTQTRELLDSLELADLQQPDRWRALRTLVQIQPAGDRLPVRAAFSDLGDDPSKLQGQYGNSQSYLTCKEPLWFTLADLIASKLATGRAASVIRAIEFTPRPPQDGLTAINVLGNPDYRVDPYHDDFYKRLIDLRADIKAQGSKAELGLLHG